MKKIFLVIFILFLVIFLFSQDAVALLIKGPEELDSLDFLGPNAIKNYYANYQYKNTSVDIYYTDETIVPFSEWTNERIGKYNLKTFYYDNKKIYYYGVSGRYYIFLMFSDENIDKKLFVLKLIDRIDYFYRLSLRTGEVPIPAVLDLTK